LFFWWLSGGCTEVLSKLPTERNKFFGIGAAILGTGILASISGSYAFFIVTHNIYASIFLGVLWGALILNLDRFITSSMKKSGDELRNYFFSEKFCHRIAELGPALPRLVIALIIGIVISKPIELKLFESEIDEKLVIDQQQSIQEAKLSLQKKYFETIHVLKKEQRELESKIVGFRREVNQLRTNWLEELNGTPGRSSGQSGNGPIAKQKERVYKDAVEELSKNKSLIQPEIERKKTQIHKLESELSNKHDLLEKHIGSGLLAKIEALSSLAAQNGTVWWTNILIISLICLIEMAPVFVKLISDRGPYDAQFDHINKKLMFEADYITREIKRNNSLKMLEGPQRDHKHHKEHLDIKYKTMGTTND
jgi:hypothetical protein